MAEPTMASKLRELPAEQRDRLERALKDGLTGRKALMRAYETIGERMKDSETRAMLQRFAREEQQQFDEATRIVQRYGLETGMVEGIKSEVMAFLGKTVMGGGEGPYADLRDLTMLYGVEKASELAIEPLEQVAEMFGDREWKQVIERSDDLCDSHCDYLKGRVDQLAREAFGIR